MIVFTEVRRRYNEEEAELFAVIAKAIWARQNEMIFGEEFIHPNSMVNRAVNNWNLFNLTKEYRDAKHGPSEISENEKWSGPPSGTYKVNWDIAIDVQMKCMGLGVIIRDGMGRVATALSKTLNSLQDPTFDEALGARGAMEFAKDLGFNEIIPEGDSKQVVMAISSEE
jgi:hypothetical protein